MKAFLAIGIFGFLLFGCSDKKIEETAVEKFAPDEVVYPDEPNDGRWLYGEITDDYANDGCAILIDTPKSGMFMPLELNDKFKIDGLKVRIIYQLARNPGTSDCSKGQPILLEKIQAIEE